jgi:hypothetical protein
MNTQYIINMLNRCFPQEGISKVSKKYLDYTAETNGDWQPIVEILLQLEFNGIVKILKNPIDANADEICIQFLKFADGTEFPANWIRDV